MSNPPAGWYDDPAADGGAERYWDGAQWTDQVRAVAAPAPAPPPPGPDVGVSPAPPGPGAVAPGPDAGVSPAPPGPVAAVAAVPPVPGGEAVPAPPGPGPGPEPGPGPGPQSSAPASAGGIGGIRTELLTDERYAETDSSHRVTRQNSRLLKVVLGEDVLARQGSMVAFQGAIDFDHEGSGAGKFLKKALTGEGLPLMRCTGQGELFLADSAHQIHIIYLEGAGLTINGRNILAFEPSLSWEIERLKGVGIAAGGLYNTRLEGHGWVAITTDGDPVVLRTDTPTFADSDAAVAWSSSLTTTLNRTVKAKALIGRGSGEAAQLAFQGQGVVIIQPSEGPAVPPHSH